MAVPLTCPNKKVDKAWIDYNGHMNMAYYNLVFDNCLDHIYDGLGIGVDYTQQEGGSCFTMEIHVNYLQELSLDDPITVTWQLLDCDTKRLHFFQHMYHATDGYLAATSEQLSLHIDMTSRRSAPLPEAVQGKLKLLMTDHADLPRPDQAGQVIGIRRR